MTFYLYRILNPIFFQCNALCQIFLKLAQMFWRTKWKMQIYYTNDNNAANHRQQTHVYQKSSLEPSANRRTKNISLSNYKWSWSPTGEKGRYFEKDISTENRPIYCRNELRSLSTFYTIGIKLKLEWAKGRENMLQTNTHPHTLNFGLWSFFQEIGSRSLHTFYAHWHSNGEARVHVLKKEDFQPWS